MIMFCQDEISTHPAGTDFTVRFHGEFNFHPGNFHLVFVYRNP